MSVVLNKSDAGQNVTVGTSGEIVVDDGVCVFVTVDVLTAVVVAAAALVVVG